MSSGSVASDLPSEARYLRENSENGRSSCALMAHCSLAESTTSRSTQHRPHRVQEKRMPGNGSDEKEDGMGGRLSSSVGEVVLGVADVLVLLK
jgi:hypothetical protein